jgi:Ni/Fe-hydrogenase subunit HybB-like protein
MYYVCVYVYMCVCMYEYVCRRGFAVAQLFESLSYKAGRSRASLEFFIGLILPAALWSWG